MQNHELAHLQNIKKESKYDDKIIDCCKEDPEKMLEQCYEEGHVNVYNTVNEERAIMTAELIQECFEKRNTGIREAACQYRINRLADEMNICICSEPPLVENDIRVSVQRFADSRECIYSMLAG